MNDIKRVIDALREIAETDGIQPETVKKLTPEEYELVKQLKEDNLITEALEFSQTIKVKENWNRLESDLDMDLEPKKPLWKKSLKYAAMLAIILGLGLLFQSPFLRKPMEENLTNGAVELQLENGAIKILNQSESYEISSAKGDVIRVKEGDVLNYNSSEPAGRLEYNMLKVPYGRTFKLVLSDGTKIQLNSGSSLRYPIQFVTGKNRIVYLQGEAYFEVAKDKNHPFEVKADQLNIQVLGTKFNVSAYKDDKQSHIVLVEGAVSLSSAVEPGEKSVLRPGFKGAVNNETPDSIFIKKVDIKRYTDWLSGGIVFRDTAFDEIIRTLSRNYNVVIESNYNSLNAKKFTASFNKNIEGIDDILESIAEIYPFTYSRSGNKISIKP